MQVTYIKGFYFMYDTIETNLNGMYIQIYTPLTNKKSSKHTITISYDLE
jgi:hypothetical protein